MGGEQLPGTLRALHQTRAMPANVAQCSFSDMDPPADTLAWPESTQLALAPHRQGVFPKVSHQHCNYARDRQAAGASANIAAGADDADTQRGALKPCFLPVNCDLIARPGDKSGQHLSLFASVEQCACSSNAPGTHARTNLLLRKGDGKELASLELSALVVSRYWGLASSTERIMELTVSEPAARACDVVYLQFNSLSCLEHFGCMTGCSIE